MVLQIDCLSSPEECKYSILLSAYACEPGLGSEAAVGWGWAVNLAQSAHHVHVLTRSSNRARIELSNLVHTCRNLQFTYFDLPPWMRFWKRGNRGVHLYYLLWQVGAYFVARRLVRKRHFDLVHQVTYVTARFPSLMGLLGLPFVYGPLAGGEYAPRALWQGMEVSGVIKESLRYVSMSLWRLSPLLNLTFFSARRIFATSNQTLHQLPKHAQRKAQVMLGIAWDSDDGGGTFRHARSGTFEILYAGHFVYLKGMEYGLEAVARLLDEHPHIRLTMLGEGPSFTRWLKKSQSLGLDANVRWIKSMPRDEFLRRLPFYDALLFPSLHDSGGMVVLEAMAAGLPVVCLDLGGPGVLVDETCGFKVTAADPAATVAGLHKALQQLVADESLGVRLGNAGRRRAHEVFSWKGRVARMLRCYKEVLGK